MWLMVFLNRGTSGRSAENPLGNMSRKYVRLNNMLVSRMILLILVGIVIGVHFLLEQPLTTLMHRPLLLPNNAPNVLNITMCVCLCVIASLIHTKRYEYIDLRHFHHRFRDMLKVLYTWEKSTLGWACLELPVQSPQGYGERSGGSQNFAGNCCAERASKSKML